MPADETRHELVPIPPAFHTGESLGIRRSGPSMGSRVAPTVDGHARGLSLLTFVGVRGGRGKMNGLHVCEASIEALEPAVGDDIQRNVGGKTYSL